MGEKNGFFLYRIVYLLILISIGFFSGGCGLFENEQCIDLVEQHDIRGTLMQRYTTKFVIEFVDTMSYKGETVYLTELGFPYEFIWEHTYVVESGCDIDASFYYTNYGTPAKISLGDSSFVEYVDQVFFYPQGESDYMINGNVAVQFDRSLAFEQIQKVVDSLHLEFREFNPGAEFNRYILNVRKQACCNPIDMAEILLEFDEVMFADPLFIFTIPNPTNPNLKQNKENIWYDNTLSPGE